MERKRNLSNYEKKMITYLYQTKNWSMGKIADELGYSKRTVSKYKNY